MNVLLKKDKKLKMIEVSQNEEMKDIQIETNQNEESQNNKKIDEPELSLILCPKNKKRPELSDQSIENNNDESIGISEDIVELSNEDKNIEESNEQQNNYETQNNHKKIVENENNDTDIQTNIDNNNEQDILNDIMITNNIEDIYFHEIIIRKQNNKNNFKRKEFQGYKVINVTKINKITKKDYVKPKENILEDMNLTKLTTDNKKPKKAKRKTKNNSIHMLGKTSTKALITQNKACSNGMTGMAVTNFFPRLLTPGKNTKVMPLISEKTNDKKVKKTSKKTSKTLKNTIITPEIKINKITKNTENLQKRKNMKKYDKRYVPINIVPKNILPKKIVELNNVIDEIKYKNPYNNIEYWLKLTQHIQSETLMSQQSYISQNSTVKNQSRKIIEERANREFKKGNIGKAFQSVMMKNKSPVIPTEEQLNTLFKKSTMDPIEVNDNVQPFIVTLPMVEMTMKTMKNGKGVGISMLSSEHVRQLISDEKQMEFLRTSIQSLINNPTKVPRQTYKSKLICIKKESGLDLYV